MNGKGQHFMIWLKLMEGLQLKLLWQDWNVQRNWNQFNLILIHVEIEDREMEVSSYILTINQCRS